MQRGEVRVIFSSFAIF